MNRIKTQPLNQWAGSSIPVAVTLISEQVCPPCRSCRRKKPSPVIIGSRLRAVKLGHLVARVTVEFSSPLSHFSHFRSSPHSPFIASAEQHHPLSPPTPDKINYIPLQWYHQVLLLVIEKHVWLPCFLSSRSAVLNGAACLSPRVWYSIIIFHWVMAFLFCNGGKKEIVTSAAFSWCYTQRWSIIEWFCEGINEIRDCVYSSVALD